MTVTANMSAHYAYDTLQRPRKIILGVCARLSEASGVAVWAIRVFALLLGLFHGFIAIVLYLGAAWWLRAPRDAAGAAPAREWHDKAWDRKAWDQGLSGRFSRLDERLAELEREAWDREAQLRRDFRDLR